MSAKAEIFVSVDVETSGPVPGEFSLLTIGACAVDNPERTFSCSLKPIGDDADPEAMAVAGLSMDELRVCGLDPAAAMASFAAWLTELSADKGKLVFVGLNAPFDWSFVNYYFHRFSGENPFGFVALDIKAFYMGATGCRWDETKSSSMAARLRPAERGTHDALEDAVYQAELFRLARKLAGSGAALSHDPGSPAG